MTRWSRERRAAYEAEGEALLFDLIFLTGARCSNQAENNYIHEGGRGFFFLSEFFGFIFIVFAVMLCHAVLSLSYIYIKKKISTLPGVCKYVPHTAFGLYPWMEHGALGICKPPVCT